MVSAGTLCVHSFNGAAFGKIGPYRSETVIKRGRWRGWVNEPMCSDGIIIEHCGREGDAVAKIDCDRSNNDSWKKKGKIGTEFGWKDETFNKNAKRSDYRRHL